MSASNEDQLSHLAWLNEEVSFYESESILPADRTPVPYMEEDPGDIESAKLFLEGESHSKSIRAYMFSTKALSSGVCL